MSYSLFIYNKSKAFKVVNNRTNMFEYYSTLGDFINDFILNRNGSLKLHFKITLKNLTLLKTCSDITDLKQWVIDTYPEELI